MTDPARLRLALRDYALSLPEAYEDHPWGERVVKVRKKVFIFLSGDDYRPCHVWLKLVESHALGLAQPGVEPAGYGLGKHGWVAVTLGDETPFEMLREWLDESYRAVAPKRLAASVGDAKSEEPAG
jgi:predicted DNA-binding protein (MmcQ/YjbR family)